MTGSTVRPGKPIYRPPESGQRPPGLRPPGYRPPSYGPPGYRPPYPGYGYPLPYWGWGDWRWPHWGWGAWRPYYWGSWGFWGSYGEVYSSPAPGVVESYPIRSRLPARGGFDLKVKPKNAQVWVDGEYAGLAKDFDGYPSYLWMAAGSHEVSFYLPGYEPVTRGVDVLPGSVGDFELRLSRGDSGPPPGPFD